MLQHHPVASLGLPPIDQIGFVVRDVEAAIAYYEPMFGPFSKPGISPELVTEFRGRPSRVSLSVSLGKTGAVEIELIQWLSGDSPHREFIEQGREGMHHLRFSVTDVAAWVDKVRAVGYRSIWSGRLENVRWDYLERPGDPLIIEFVQWSTPS